MTESRPEITSSAQEAIQSIEEKFCCTLNLDVAEEVIRLAISQYDALPNNYETQPEHKYMTFLKEQGFDDDKLLHAVFFMSTLMFQTNTSMFFERLSMDSELFKEYSWIFDPQKIVEKGKEATIEACIKHLKPIGMQKKALEGWYHNAEILVKSYRGRLKEFFVKYNNYAPDIARAIYIAPRAKSNRKEFYRFGPKLTSLFLQWVDRYRLYDLESFDKVGLPVDYQLMRISLQTGIVELEDVVNAHNLSFNILSPLFMIVCEKNAWDPRIVSEALWTLGSTKCSKAGEKPEPTCPINGYCKGVIGGNHTKDKFPPLKDNPAFKAWK